MPSNRGTYPTVDPSASLRVEIAAPRGKLEPFKDASDVVGDDADGPGCGTLIGGAVPIVVATVVVAIVGRRPWVS